MNANARMATKYGLDLLVEEFAESAAEIGEEQAAERFVADLMVTPPLATARMLVVAAGELAAARKSAQS